jgi:hypothetical protein
LKPVSGDNSAAPTSVVRLSDDEVIANALARQEASNPRTMFEIPVSEGGMAASNDYSLAKQIARNGGLSVTVEGVPNEVNPSKGNAALAVANVKAQVENWGSKGFNDYRNNAFTRYNAQLRDGLMAKAADSVLMDKQILARNSDNPVRMSTWDGKGSSLPPSQYEINRQ